MTGKSAWSGRGRLRVSGAGAAMVALLVGAATTPVTADPAISCSYSATSWHGGFSADLSIANGGPVIDGWTVRMVFPTPTTLGSAWLASITQTSAFDMVATNMSWNAVIGTGQVGTFGWTATGTETGVPTAVSVNGTPC